jgi:hypothetical protein
VDVHDPGLRLTNEPRQAVETVGRNAIEVGFGHQTRRELCPLGGESYLEQDSLDLKSNLGEWHPEHW